MDGGLTCMGDLHVGAGQRGTEPHALRLVVRVNEVDHLSLFGRDTALGKLVPRFTDSALVCEQHVMARVRVELGKTRELHDFAFKLDFDFVCRRARVD